MTGKKSKRGLRLTTGGTVVKKRLTKYLCVISTVAFGIVSFASISNAQTKWSAYTYAPSMKLPSAAALDKLAAELKTATDGELNLQVNLGGSLPIKFPILVKPWQMVSYSSAPMRIFRDLFLLEQRSECQC